MKALYIVPGFADIYYCQNCIRDFNLAKTLNNEHDIDLSILPMYLPLQKEDEFSGHIIYPAVELYIKELFPFIKNVPGFISRILSSKPVLGIASKLSSQTTNPKGLEEMTISVMLGEDGRQKDELEKLISFLKSSGKPNIIHLSNALLIGLASGIKKAMPDVKVICSLQDEDSWIEAMDGSFRERAWQTVNEKSAYVDRFIAVSQYYKRRIMELASIDSEKISVLHPGADLSGLKFTAPSEKPFAIGYLSRMSDELGFERICRAFIDIKKDPRFDGLRLIASGGAAASDKPLIKRMERLMRRSGIWHDCSFNLDMYREDLPGFLNSISVLSVPAIPGESAAAYILQAAVSGAPSVQPKSGAYPELIERSKAGIIYGDTHEELCSSLKEMLLSSELREKIINESYHKIDELFSMRACARETANLYKGLGGLNV